MAEYYRALVQQDENQRVLIHDIRRHLASIDTLAAAKETDKIHAYIKHLQTAHCFLHLNFVSIVYSNSGRIVSAVLQL
jgi:hypothetical protein